MRNLLRLAAATGLFLAALQTLRMGWADYLFREDTLQSVLHAARICSRNADFHARLADLDPVNAISHLRHAVSLDPRLSKSWIALGLQLELEGSPAQAERCYLQAARDDRQFLPAWTLANFYSRRSDAARFWPWARIAAQMSYDNVRPLLRLAFMFTNQEDLIMDRIVVPRRKVQHEFLQYLLDRNMDASAIAARILSRAEKQDLPPLMAWMNRLIDTRRISEARRLWDALSDKRLISYPRLSHLTNASFSQEPLQASGFDWRMTPPPGVDCERTGEGLRVQFSGQQPETFELLSQYLGLTGGTYGLSFEYRTVDVRTTTNLRWRMGEWSSEPLPAAENWTHASGVFKAGPVNRLILLEQRDNGTTRPEGVVYLRGLALTSLRED
jgi:tetratricopeptide (TPR) repeat protein